MKIRIKSGDCPSYLTVGKVYDARQASDTGALFTITDDRGKIIYVFIYLCAHLNCGSWEIVDEIKCWSCDKMVDKKEVSYADGFCPLCDAEIIND